jgi:ABC-type nitrate/sulfonate/bicarbonate transport system permease component
MNTVVKVLTPFKTLSQSEKLWSTVAVIVLIMVVWSLSGHAYIPTPMEILGAFPSLLEQNDLIRNFIKSISFCLETMLYSLLISLFFTYLSVLPLFSTFCEFLRKFRFLPSVGLSFFFTKLSGGELDTMMTYMMVFGITTWMLYAFIDIALSITSEEIMYAKSLRLKPWQRMREILIFGKAADLFLAAIGVFAIAWMILATVENLAKASGGIGVVLAESNKYFKMEKVYAVQILILVTGIALDWILRQIRYFLFPYAKLK